MAYGLLDNLGNIYIPDNISCNAEVTDDFGLFKLVHEYSIDISNTTAAKYIFPVTDTMEMVSFKAVINERVISSSIIPKPNKADSAYYFSSYNTGGFETSIGEIGPGDKICIEIVFVNHLTSDNERTRIIIPTGVAPRFMYFGSQVALETLFEEIKYNISLNLIYKNYHIKNVVSPTHEIISVYGENCVEVRLKNGMSSDKDIVIDVFSVMRDKPKFIRYEKYFNCSFVPELNIYEDTPRDYIFIIDISSDMNTRKVQQVKNALNLCIRTLKTGDRFNIAFAQSENTFFSDEYLPLNDDTLRASTKWINGYKNDGVPEFYRPISEIYKMTEKNAIAIFISDGRISGNSSILKHVKEQKKIRFYNFGFDMAVNQDFLTELSSITGGKTRFIRHTERVDDTIIKAFNVIVSPSIDNAVVRFASSVSEVTPNNFNKIHCGERINVMFKYIDSPPEYLFIKGFVGGRETICKIPIDNVIDGGRELKYKFGYEAVQNYMRTLYYAEEKNKYGIKQKIVSASVKYSVHSKYTMFKITDKNGWFNAECDIDKCSEISSGWYENSLVTDDNLLLHSGEEIRNMEVIKKQRANGRFIPNTSRSKEAIALYTAQIVLEMCNKCPNVMMYKWHLRKSVLFLLDYIENAESAVIPDDIMLALEVWNSIFGGNDEASQKIEVLNYFHNEE
ncbi:MAG: VWA domain-containing protein [Clostridia bacterium]|nr:VWA domain-containing protein [Clostridia bacterium]